jgi:hypothetical protein
MQKNQAVISTVGSYQNNPYLIDMGGQQKEDISWLF